MLTDQQQAILIGSLLGDGRLECRSLGGTARFRVHHADSHRELVFWKYNYFRELVCSAPWYNDWLDKRFDQTYRSWFFHTITTDLFRPAWTRFYTLGKKQIPEDIIQDLSPLTMAVWIMDDGCLAGNSIILNTQSFSSREQDLLLKALDQRYGIQGAINRDRRNFRLRFNLTESRKLSEIARPFVIESEISKIVPVSTESANSRVQRKLSQHVGSRK